MSASVAAFAVLVGFAGVLILACVGDLVSEEVRARLDRLPHSLIALAARRVPADVRAELADEWTAELHEIVRGAQAFPVTRLVIGTRYGAVLLRTARRIGREVSPATHPRDQVPRVAGSALFHDAIVGTTVSVIVVGAIVGGGILAVFGIEGLLSALGGVGYDGFGVVIRFIVSVIVGPIVSCVVILIAWAAVRKAAERAPRALPERHRR